MPSRKLLWGLGVPLVLIAMLFAAVAMGPERSTNGTAQGEWTCSMHPQIRRSMPGQCPICGMDLVPVSQESTAVENQPGIETELVAYRELSKEIRTVGKIDYHEARVADITARIAGRVDRLYADFTGITVKKEDHLVDIYSPDLIVAQEELIRQAEALEQAKTIASPSRRAEESRMLEAARTKLRLWGMLPGQVEEIRKSGKSQTHLTIHAPIGGTVIEKAIREGQYVQEGNLLYRIADFAELWLYLDIYESDLGWVRYGQLVRVTVEAFPGERFEGMVTFINPFLDDQTRTVKVRVNLKNPEKKLKPAMYATATIRVRLQSDGTPEPTGLEGKYVCPMHPEVIRDDAGRCSLCGMPLERVPASPRKDWAPIPEAPNHQQAQDGPLAPAGHSLAIPASAVLDTGRRKVAFRIDENGHAHLVELEVGPRAEGTNDAGRPQSYYPVLAGLHAGDKLVVRGGFLLDSQRQIEGKPSLLFPEGLAGAPLHSGHGARGDASPAAEHKH